MSVLEIRDLVVDYTRHRHGRGDSTLVRAVAGVSLDVERGQIVGLVGESGCGKSTLARAIVGMVPPTAGSVVFEGHPVRPLTKRARPTDLRRLQMVFQNPYSSLNRRRKVGAQIRDALELSHGGKALRIDPRAKVAELMERVGLSPNATERFPHEFSGGQLQRLVLARALAADPSVIVLDEPLSSLDASAQAQIANLLVELTRDLGVSLVLISHDLAVVRHVADVVAVMYLGVIVEQAPTAELWSSPSHPYTQALIKAVPHADGRGYVPEAVAGEVPDPAAPPPGCRFSPRCPHCFERCVVEVPVPLAAGPEHEAACWLLDEEREGRLAMRGAS